MIEISVNLGIVSITDQLTALSSADNEEEAVSAFLHKACASASEDELRSRVKLMAAFFLGASTDANRPFEGQEHTMFGERGKQEITGVRMRDLADCLLRSIAYCCWEQLDEDTRNRVETDQYDFNEVYKLDLNKSDPIAIMQNLIVEVEKTMGIYPNVPELVAVNTEA